jgi:hypothetical protein
MRITTKITWNMLTGEVLEHEFYEYSGPLVLCVRAIQQAASANATQAGADASQYGQTAANESAALTPFYTQEMKAKHAFDPTQINEMLTAAGAGTGAAMGAEEGTANLEAARTRNAGGFTKALDEAARDRMKTAAGVSEGVASEDVMGAKQLNQAGAQGLSGLYGTNVGAQLKAMGQQNEDLQTELAAGQSGWYQNMLQGMETSADVANSVANVMAACPVWGSKYTMADGSELPVENLHVGDQIMGIDGEPQTIEEIQIGETPIIKVTLDNGLVSRSSRVHAFALPYGGFTVAIHSLGKTIRTRHGLAKVISVEQDGHDTVFNVITDGSHTYLADGIWALGVGEAERQVSMDKWNEIGNKLEAVVT